MRRRLYFMLPDVVSQRIKQLRLHIRPDVA